MSILGAILFNCYAHWEACLSRAAPKVPASQSQKYLYDGLNTTFSAVGTGRTVEVEAPRPFWRTDCCVPRCATATVTNIHFLRLRSCRCTRQAFLYSCEHSQLSALNTRTGGFLLAIQPTASQLRRSQGSSRHQHAQRSDADMADGTASLRTAQQALQDGLITDADYEQARTCF